MEEPQNNNEQHSAGKQNASHHQAHRASHSTISKIKGHVGALESWLESIFNKAPHLPEKWLSFLTTALPWLSIIFGVISLSGFLFSGAIGLLFSPILALTHGVHSFVFFVNAIVGVFVSIMAILAFKPLLAMKKEGWDLSFYAFVASAATSLLGILVMFGGAGNAIGILLGAYLLFEIRKYYN